MSFFLYLVSFNHYIYADTIKDSWYIYFYFLSVLHGHLVFSSQPQRSMTSDFHPRFYPLLFLSILILEKESVFSLILLSAKQENYWYHFYNVFGMTRSLTGDWSWDLRMVLFAELHLTCIWNWGGFWKYKLMCFDWL